MACSGLLVGALILLGSEDRTPTAAAGVHSHYPNLQHPASYLRFARQARIRFLLSTRKPQLTPYQSAKPDAYSKIIPRFLLVGGYEIDPYHFEDVLDSCK